MERGFFAEAAIAFGEANDAAIHYKSLELQGECFMKMGQYSRAVVPLAAAMALNSGVRAAALLAEALYKSGIPELKEHTTVVLKIAQERDPRNRKAREIQDLIQRE